MPTDSPAVTAPRGQVNYSARRNISAIITALILLGYAFIGPDLFFSTLFPLTSLRPEWTKIANNAVFIGPIFAAVMWFFVRKKFPLLSILIAYVSCVAIMTAICTFEEHQLDRIPNKNYLSIDEQTTLQKRLPFRIVQQHTQSGNQIVIIRNANHHQQVLTQIEQLVTLPVQSETKP